MQTPEDIRLRSQSHVQLKLLINILWMSLNSQKPSPFRHCIFVDKSLVITVFIALACLLCELCLFSMIVFNFYITSS